MKFADFTIILRIFLALQLPAILFRHVGLSPHFIRPHSSTAEKEVIKKIKSNQKAFFNYAKKFNKSTSKVGPLKDENGIFQTDSGVKANILQSQYTKVFSRPMDVPETEENIEIK